MIVILEKWVDEIMNTCELARKIIQFKKDCEPYDYYDSLIDEEMEFERLIYDLETYRVRYLTEYFIIMKEAPLPSIAQMELEEIIGELEMRY